MKKLLLYLLLFFSILSSATAQQQKSLYAIGTFLGMKWGLPQDSLKQRMRAFPDVQFDDEKSTSTKLVYYGGVYEGKEVEMTLLESVSDRFLKGSVVIESEKENILTLFREMKMDLVKKFGKPKTDLDQFEVTYSTKEIGREADALAENQYQLLAAWFFPNESDTREIISLTADREFKITLTIASTMIGKVE